MDPKDVRSAKSITIKDVAKVAEVSTATVSRVLNSPETVSPNTRQAVLRAAERTGYQLNLAARNLRIKQTGSITVFVPDLSNPFFSHILAGIEAEAARAGKSVFLLNTQGPQAGGPDTWLQYVTPARTDGIIILDGTLKKGLLEEKHIAGVSPPVVFACEWAPMDKFPSVRTDNQLGARLAIKHLLDLGHRKIGHVPGPEWNVLAKERLIGTQECLQEAGIPFHDPWMFDGDFTIQAGVDAAQRFLNMSDRPTAVFCACDVTAIGFISELHAAGLVVPKDVSVVGFDDIDIAKRFIPSLTTIYQPREEIGRNAVKMLTNVMNGTIPQAYHKPTVLPVQLVARDSSRAIS